MTVSIPQYDVRGDWIFKLEGISALVDGTTLIDNAGKIELNLANANTWTTAQTITPAAAGYALTLNTGGLLVSGVDANGKSIALSSVAATTTTYIVGNANLAGAYATVLWVTPAQGTGCGVKFTTSSTATADQIVIWAGSIIALTIGNGTTPRYMATADNVLDDGNGNSTIAGVMTSYASVVTRGIGIPPIYGLDARIGRTTTDASPITLYTTILSGEVYRICARAFSTVGTSATYVITWTEGGVVNSTTLNVTALDTPVSDEFLVQPDAATAITAQITAITATTLNVATSVEQIN